MDAQLQYPDYVLLSQNHCAARWASQSAARRLRNVVIILEWIPDTNALVLIIIFPFFFFFFFFFVFANDHLK